MNVLHNLSRKGLVLGLVLSAMTAGLATIKVEVNGRMLAFAVPPMKVQNRTMVPLRTVFESLGAQVDWNAPTRVITMNKDTTNVQLSIGQKSATVNGHTVLLDVPAMIMRGVNDGAVAICQ